VTEPAEPAVAVAGLVKTFDEVVAIADLSLRVELGRLHGLVGPNGAGKTTLLSVLLGLVRPDEGTVRLFGRNPAEEGTQALDGVGGFVESPGFYPYLTARRNLELLAGLDAPGTDQRARIGELLELVGLADRADRKVRGFSVGMRQRLGIAAALLREPKLLVLDEPASGLDPAGLRDLHALLRKLSDDGVTILLSSHNMDEVEDLCTYVSIVRAGTIVFDGTMESLREQAPDPAFRMSTSDDSAAIDLAESQAGVAVSKAGNGLLVRAQRESLDAYVIELGKKEIAVRGLELETTALTSLFFSLTEEAA
jgi:ABC-2 type transport system ATP-binding protein